MWSHEEKMRGKQKTEGKPEKTRGKENHGPS
jgi:hypothetical protein